jgi:Uma2 family endonuclease
MSGSLGVMDRARVEPPEPAGEERDQVVVMRGVSWSVYQTLLDARGERPRPRLAYLDGELEIMTTSRRHEIGKTMLARLLEAYVEARNFKLNGIGNAMFQKELEEAGLEPDECYCTGPMREFPDLAIEIVQTSGGIDKLEIYRRLGVGEVWFWIDGAIWVYVVVAGKFREAERSRAFPDLDLHELARIVLTTDDSDQMEAVRDYRAVLVERSERARRARRRPKRR